MAYKDPEEARSWKRRWRQSHKEQEQLQQRRYREAHKEQRQAYQQQYYAEWIATHRREHSESATVYYQEHKDERLAYAKGHYHEHRREKLAYQSAYSASHKKEARVYRKAHLDEIVVRNRNRYSLLHATGTRIARSQWEAIKRAYGGRCAYCHGTAKRLTMDHFIPLSRGGIHTVSNIVPACGHCNSSKGNRIPSFTPPLRLLL